MNAYAFRCLAALAMCVLFGSALAQQASLTLQSADASLFQGQVSDWSLHKTGVLDGDTVTWTVTYTKSAPTDTGLLVNGYVDITNTGSAPATIGNIVVNLQQQKVVKGKNTWVSVAADVADATSGDAATSAKIVAAASTETANGLSYLISGAQGTFLETAGKSGTLTFTDEVNNTVWSITPQQTIPVGATVTLLFQAQFTVSLPVGSSVRPEVLVTFGNAGGRGGSGASAKNIDINGNGTLDPDEANVRTVPTRVTRAVPAVQSVYLPATITDPSNTFDQGVSGSFTALEPLAVSDSGSATLLTTAVSGGVDGGYICNTAYLHADGVTQTIGGVNFVVIPDLDLSATDCVLVPGDSVPPTEYLDQTTYTQGGYGGRGGPFDTLAANFAAIGGSVTVGTGPFHMTFTSASAIQAYLPAGGQEGALTVSLNNPTSTSAGVFGGQVLALKINVLLSDAGAIDPGLRNLKLKGLGAPLDGLTVGQVLADAEALLGGGTSSYGLSIADMNALVTNLNESFDNGTESTWAQAHLTAL